MAEYRYYLIPDFMSHVFPQQFEEQAPTEFFSNTADLMKRYKQLREMPYNNEYTWNERTNLPYPRLTVGIDRRDPDGAVTIMQVRNGVNYLCDDYRGPFADCNDKQLIEMAKQLVTAVGVDRIRPHYYTEENGHTKVHVGNDIHITEWANAPELCRALRFSRFLNRDGQQLFQVRNGQRVGGAERQNAALCQAAAQGILGGLCHYQGQGHRAAEPVVQGAGRGPHPDRY